MSFRQPDHETTFSEFGELLGDLHAGAAVIGLLSVAILVIWDRWTVLKKSPLPAPLVVVVLGVACQLFFRRLGSPWAFEASHLVQVPVTETLEGLSGFLKAPDFAQWRKRFDSPACPRGTCGGGRSDLRRVDRTDRVSHRGYGAPAVEASRQLSAARKRPHQFGPTAGRGSPTPP